MNKIVYSYCAETGSYEQPGNYEQHGNPSRGKRRYDHYEQYKSSLLPCPFCGGDARFAAHYSGTTTDYRIECCKCWAETPRYTDKKAAWENWNRRGGVEYADRYIADKATRK